MSRPTDFDCWTIAKLRFGASLNGEMEQVSTPLRKSLAKAKNLSVESRFIYLDGLFDGLPDGEDVIRRVAETDPKAPPPDTTALGRSYATLEDIAKITSGQVWLWRNWLASGVLNALASEPGTGKTRFAMDIARRLWFGEPWPDGQENTLPKESRTLWVQGDRNFAEMLQVSRDFGLPDNAVALGSTPDNPLGGLNLDDQTAIGELTERTRESGVALVVIDTVGMTTGRNLCKPEEAREFFAPLIEFALSTEVALLCLTHLSKDKEALGRRIVEKARVVIKMTKPDPDGQPNRRRLWVDKTAVVNPAPLGITMTGAGNEYDSNPPAEAESFSRRGPNPDRLDEAKKWLGDRLRDKPSRVTVVRDEAEALAPRIDSKLLYRAKDSLGIDEYEVVDGKKKSKWWKLPDSKTEESEPSASY